MKNIDFLFGEFNETDQDRLNKIFKDIYETLEILDKRISIIALAQLSWEAQDNGLYDE